MPGSGESPKKRRSPIGVFQELSERESLTVWADFRVYELVGESIKNTWLPGKSYFAFLFNKTAEERTETVRHSDKHSQSSAAHCEYISPRVAHCIKSIFCRMDSENRDRRYWLKEFISRIKRLQLFLWWRL